MKNLIALAIGLQFFSLIGPANADEVGGISGQIKDSRGHPVSNAKVSIDGKSDFTDSEGQYRIQGISEGNHEVLIEKNGRKLVDEVEINNTVIKKDLSIKK